MVVRFVLQHTSCVVIFSHEGGLLLYGKADELMPFPLLCIRPMTGDSCCQAAKSLFSLLPLWRAAVKLIPDLLSSSPSEEGEAADRLASMLEDNETLQYM